MALDFTNKKIVVGTVLVAVVVLVGAGVAVARTMSHGPKTVAKAFVQLAEADTLHASVQLAMNLPTRLQGRNRPLTHVDITIAGDVDRAENGTPELTGTLKGEARGRGTVFFIDGETRILREDMAFNLAEFPSLLNPSGSLSNKWTYVDVPLLHTNNGDQLRAVAAALAQRAEYQGRATIADTSTLHYTVTITPEEEDQLVSALLQQTSGNRAFHTLARLLRANNIDAFDIYINSSNLELTQIGMHFVRPVPEGKQFDFAQLTLNFTDYGKPVTIDRPKEQAHVRPEVFGTLFGSGEVQTIQ